MTRSIDKPQDIFVDVTEGFQKAFGAHLTSIVLYGNAAGGRYVPGKSELNFLIILKDAGINDLEQGIPVVSNWRKKRVFFSFMTEYYIKSSIDSYPVEFFNMKLSYVMAFGKDVLKDLVLDPRHLRLQLEREFKGKLYHLQQGFLETEGKEKRLRELIRISLGTFIPLFKALLFLKGHEIPPSGREVAKALPSVFAIETDSFIECMDIIDGNVKYPEENIKKLFKFYYEELAEISAMIDIMEI